jgi:hypothetical protein
MISKSDFRYYLKHGGRSISICFANGFKFVTKIINVSLDPIVYPIVHYPPEEVPKMRIRYVFIVRRNGNEENTLLCLIAGARLRTVRNSALIVPISMTYVKALTFGNY